MSHRATHVRLTITASYGGQPSATLKVHSPCLTGTIDTIRKLGTEDIGMTETTPVVWKGELYQFESVRIGNWNNTLNCTNDSPGEGRRCQSYLRFRKQSGPPEWKTGEVATAPFGVGWALGCAIVDEQGGRVHAFASREGGVIGTWSSDDLTPEAEWRQSEALQLPPGYTSFNTAVGKGMLPSGQEGYAMLIEVRAPLPGGFNIIVALSESLDGPWQLGAPTPAPAPAPAKPCRAPTGGFCELAHATPTHVSSGVLASGAWPAPTFDATRQAVQKLCEANSSCAAFGLGSDKRSGHAYQLYVESPTVLHPLQTDDWTLFYKNASCCEPPAPPPAVKPARIFGPGSCPALRYDSKSGYWHMLWTPNPTVGGGDYRTWQVVAARSKTLATGSWEHSPLNPVMVADSFDRQIHNQDIPKSEQGWAANTTNLVSAAFLLGGCFLANLRTRSCWYTERL